MGSRSCASCQDAGRCAPGKLCVTSCAAAGRSCARAKRYCSVSAKDRLTGATDRGGGAEMLSPEPAGRHKIETMMKAGQLFFPIVAAGTMLATAACGTAAPAPEPAQQPSAAVAPVVPGLEVLLRDSIHLVRGKRVGFLTNQSAVTSRGESGIDLLHASPDVRLVALFGPEHGLQIGRASCRERAWV